MPSAWMARAAASSSSAPMSWKCSNDALQPLAHAAAVVGAVAVGMQLEARAVVRFEHLDHQERGGVLVKVARQVADAECAAPPAGAARGGSRELGRQPARGRPRWRAGARPSSACAASRCWAAVMPGSESSWKGDKAATPGRPRPAARAAARCRSLATRTRRGCGRSASSRRGSCARRRSSAGAASSAPRPRREVQAGTTSAMHGRRRFPPQLFIERSTPCSSP